jgi:quercetin dioxygenase-like cupin family protein
LVDGGRRIGSSNARQMTAGGAAMRRPQSTILFEILAIGLVLVACGQPTTGAGGYTELHRGVVPDASDIEMVMGLIERPGQSSTAKHHHPGGEYGFVLEGTLTVAAEGDREVTLEAGDSFYQPPGQWHVVGTTAKGARTIVFRVLKRGQPMIVEVD